MHDEALAIDAIITGDAVNGNPYWGHLATGLGFISLGGLAPAAGGVIPAVGSSRAPGAPTNPATPTLAIPRARSSGLPAAGLKQLGRLPQTGGPGTCEPNGPCMIITPVEASQGALVEFLLVGFTPGQQVELMMTRSFPCIEAGNPWPTTEFASLDSLFTAPTNTRGETIYEIVTGPGDLPGTYQVSAIGDTQFERAEFSLKPRPGVPYETPPCSPDAVRRSTSTPTPSMPYTPTPTIPRARSSGVPAAGLGQLSHVPGMGSAPCEPGGPCMSVTPERAPQGALIEFLIVGYDPGEQVELWFVRDSLCIDAGSARSRVEHAELGTVLTAPMNERGETIYEVMTSATDRPGDYTAIVLGGAPFPSAEFSLTPRSDAPYVPPPCADVMLDERENSEEAPSETPSAIPAQDETESPTPMPPQEPQATETPTPSQEPDAMETPTPLASPGSP
jgi:hypothetical protein